MKTDVIVAGVGGQGVVSATAIIAEAARRDGLTVKQGELHGMSQRGGAVQATIRTADGPIESELISRGGADVIVSLEPLESLRYLDYLSPEGTVVSSTTPFENISDYPDLDRILDELRALPRAILVDAGGLARDAGSGRADNVVMIGAAAHLLPVQPETLLGCIEELFESKGPRIVEVNRTAFASGRNAPSPVPG